MPNNRREPCRNFQRGSCRFGANCKFMHATQQQPKSNAFGFGSQTGVAFQQTSTQQQKPNPFGFGVQNSSPANVAGDFAQPNAFKNTWSRSEQAGNQSQAANHNCTDPNVCKQQIAEDFNLERPLWKLTCYGHSKYLPCDITGDISFEELRAEAYSDAKRGLSLQSIVEREKTLEKSKLLEFENLLKNPYSKNTHSAPSNQSAFLAAATPQNTGPSPISSFNSQPQQGQSPNMTFGVRPPMPSNNAFGQFQGSGPFGSKSISSGPFGTQVPAQSGGTSFTSNATGFSASGTSNQQTQPLSQLGGNPFGFGVAAMTSQGNQASVQSGGSPFTPNLNGFGNGANNFPSNVPHFGNSGMSTHGSQLSSSFPVSTQVQTPVISQPQLPSNALGGTVIDGQRNKVQVEVSPVDPSIWLKDEWKLGEIPEQPPPPSVC